jgi:hypothetical protein
MRAHWLALVLALCAAGAAAQENKDLGRKLYAEAGAAMDAGDHARAEELYRRSDQAYPAPTARYWHARALMELGRLLEAYARFGEVAAWRLEPGAPPAFAEAVSRAAADRAELEPRIPVLVVTVSDAAAQVTVDGRPLPAETWGKPHRVDPGRHVIGASVAGRDPFQREIEAAERSRSEIHIEIGATVTIEPVAPPAPDTRGGSGTPAQAVAGWTLVAIGGAGIVVWAVTGGLVLQQKAEVEDHCVEIDGGSFRCDTPEAVDTAESAKTLGIVNTVALFGGIAAAAVGVTLVLTAGADETAVAVTPASLVLRGRF